jgi:hypothetical protein
MPTRSLRAGRARRGVALPRWLEASCPSTLGKPAGHRTEPRPSRSTSDSWSAVRSSVRSKLCERRSTAVNRGHSETAEIAACGQQRSTAVTPGYPWGVNYGSEGWGFDSLRARTAEMPIDQVRRGHIEAPGDRVREERDVAERPDPPASDTERANGVLLQVHGGSWAAPARRRGLPFRSPADRQGA